MKATGCDYCDFIGPCLADEQVIRDFHRAWHDLARNVDRVFGPLFEAMRKLGEQAAKARVQTDYTLAGPSKGDSK